MAAVTAASQAAAAEAATAAAAEAAKAATEALPGADLPPVIAPSRYSNPSTESIQPIVFIICSSGRALTCVESVASSCCIVL